MLLNPLCTCLPQGLAVILSGPASVPHFAVVSARMSGYERSFLLQSIGPLDMSPFSDKFKSS